MTFNDYLDNAWSTHATDPKKLADEFKSHFSLMESEDDVMAMASLIVHVCGEHLGEWEKGIDLLRKLKNNATIKDKEQMNRLMAILNLGNNPNSSMEHFSSSDQARIYSTTASALANLGGIKNANKLLTKAAEIASSLKKEDPAQRSLAIAGNNMASSLEEKIDRTDAETELMIHAAHLARIHWEMVGTWKEVERAEYRLGKTYLKAQRFDKALHHAEKCLSIVSENNDEALESFFAYEVLTLIHKSLKNQMGVESSLNGMRIAFDRLSSDDQSWCREILETI